MENKKKNTIIIVIIVVVVLLLLLFFIFGRSNGGSGSNTVSLNKTLKVSDNGIELKATSVEEYVHDEFPGEGEYVKVSLSIVNTSSSSVNLNPLEFYVENADDSASAMVLFTIDNQIDLDEIGPNETITGDLYFNIDYADSGLKLKYSPMSSSDSDYYIELN